MVEYKMEIFTAIIGKIYLSNDCNKFKYILADILLSWKRVSA